MATPQPSRRTFLTASGLLAGTAALAATARPAAADTTRLLPSTASLLAPLSGPTWMADLPGGRRLSDLSIPGTHNSGATRYGGLVQCQDVSIWDQLNMGVRFLDIRVDVVGKGFVVSHGGFRMGIGLRDVLNDCRRFLDARQRQTIILSIKQESTRTSDPVMGETWNREIEGFRDLLVTGGGDPTLDSIRRKVFVVTRCLGIPGLNFRYWDVEDHYTVRSADEWKRMKWPYVTEHIALARANRGDGRHYATFTSCTPGLTPKRFSELSNPALIKHLRDNPPADGDRTGVINVDFARNDVVEAIAARNFGRTTWRG